MPESVDDVAGLGLQKLLAPRSVAIVGVSTRPGTFGNGHASDALGARDAARLREAGVDVLVSCG
jgi:hypothetical protein